MIVKTSKKLCSEIKKILTAAIPQIQICIHNSYFDGLPVDFGAFRMPRFRKYRTSNGAETNVMLIRMGANTL